MKQKFLERTKKRGTVLLKSELRLTLVRINKAAELNEIAIEMVSFLDDFESDKVTETINNGEILEDFGRSIFIEMPMKPRENECKLHWTNSLMNDITNHYDSNKYNS